MSEFYPNDMSCSDDLTSYRKICDQLNEMALTTVQEQLKMYKYIVSHLRNKNCEGGCGTVFYFKYQDDNWYQYHKDNMICSYPPNKTMVYDEDDGIMCSECECKSEDIEDRLYRSLGDGQESHLYSDHEDDYSDSRYCARCKIDTSNLVKTKLDLCYECESYRQEVVAQLNRDLDDYHRSHGCHN